MVSLQELLLAGAHFGHLTRRWNPKMKRFIFMERNGIYIIDLKKTLKSLEAATERVREVVRNGDKILMVGTKKQAKDVIRAEAERSDQFFVTERWLGGMLTNFMTIKKSIRRMKVLEKMATDGTYDKITKKEILTIERDKEKLDHVLGGIRDMNRLPGALFVVDTRKEAIAVNEARKLRIPVIAVVDTNSDPDNIDYPIPANDDALKSIGIIAREIANAVMEGVAGAKEDAAAQQEAQALRDHVEQELQVKEVAA